MNKEIKIIAKSGKGEGLLPMKGNEAQKSHAQKNEELCNFIKNAFCVDGEVLLVQSEKQVFASKEFFMVEDSKRGLFLVAIKKV